MEIPDYQSEKKPECTKVSGVIDGPAMVKKKSDSVLKRAIFAQDFQDIRDGIIKDYVIPKAKNVINGLMQSMLETVSCSIQMMIFGEVKDVAKKGASEYYSYNRQYNQAKPISSEMSISYNYDDIYYNTKGEAEAVLRSMKEYLADYGKVPVARMYEFSNLTSPRYTDNNYGWTNLDYADSFRASDGTYYLKLPKAKPLH